MVRATHWVTTLACVALLVSGVELVISHPRFYWGENGNVLTPALFSFPIPSSRATVPTGYGYVLPDQNGWSRYLHFEAAWILVLIGGLYLVFGLVSGHFRKGLFPRAADRSWSAVSRSRTGLCCAFLGFYSPPLIQCAPAFERSLGDGGPLRTQHHKQGTGRVVPDQHLDAAPEPPFEDSPFPVALFAGAVVAGLDPLVTANARQALLDNHCASAGNQRATRNASATCGGTGFEARLPVTARHARARLQTQSS